jgi:hypothetical protein
MDAEIMRQLFFPDVPCYLELSHRTGGYNVETFDTCNHSNLPVVLDTYINNDRGRSPCIRIPVERAVRKIYLPSFISHLPCVNLTSPFYKETENGSIEHSSSR